MSEKTGDGKKNYSVSPSGKAAVWFTACNYILKGISLITVPLFTRLMIPEEYGLLAELTAAEEIFLMLSNWDISVGAYLKGLYKYSDVKFFTSVAQLFANVTTVGLYLILILIFVIFGNRFAFTPIAFLMMFMQHLFYPSYRFWLTQRQSEFAYKPATKVTLAYGLLVSLIPLCAVLAVKRTAEVKFCTTMTISALFCVPFYFKNFRYSSLWKNKDQLRDEFRFILKYQFPFLIGSLSLVLLTQLDRIIIGQMVGYEQTAYYGVACSITSALIVLYSSIGQAFLPWKYEKLKSREYNIIKKTESKLLAGASIVTLMFISGAPEVMKILFPDSYYEAVLCIPALTAGAFFNYSSSFFSSIETYYEKTKYSAFGMVLCSGMNILLNFLLIDRFGYSVCAYTTAFSYFVYVMIHSIFLKMTIQQVGLKVKLCNTQLIILTCISLLPAIAFVMWLYPYPVIRYGFIFALIMIAIWKHKLLTELIRSISSSEK